MVVKPAGRVFGVGLMSLSADSKSGEVHGLVECRYIEREDDQKERESFKRDGGAKREMRARAQVGRALYL